MRYGIAGLLFVLEVRPDSGAKGMVVCGSCANFLIGFDERRSVVRGAQKAHGMLKRPTCWRDEMQFFMR